MKLPAYFQRADLTFGISSIFLVALLMALHGLLPGMAGPLAARFMALGAMTCGSQSISALLEAKCAFVGGEAGGVFTTGSPVKIAGAVLFRMLAINIEWVFTMVGVMVISLALFGAYKLIRAMNVSRYVALASGGLYLLLPLTLSMQAFGGTYWGFLLLPASLYSVWRFLQVLPHMGWRGKVATAALWVLLSTFLLFMDGYSFFMYSLASGILLTVWAWGRWRQPYVWLAGGMFILASVIAYFAYSSLIPSAGSWSSSIDLVRAMGLDIATLFIPAGSLWWVDLFNLRSSGMHLWGDGSNSSSNYIGLILLGLFIAGVYTARKKLSKLGTALLIVGSIAFVLSLGPSLKIHSERPPLSGSVVTHKSYLMPSSEAVVGLPTEALYQHAPGLQSMRAAYRWHIMTLLVLVVFAAVAVQALLNQKKTALAYTLLALMCLEMAPSPLLVKAKIEAGSQLARFNQNVIQPLETYIQPGERILFYPNAVGGNDYLASYIAPKLEAWTYNIGGDKSGAIAAPLRPSEVNGLLRTDDADASRRNKSGSRMENVLEKGFVDSIVVPKFDLRWDSYSWPPRSNDAQLRAQDVIQSAREEKALSIQEDEYFYIVSIKE